MLRRSIAYEFRAFLIAAGLLGVPLGTALLTDCNSHLVRLAVGALILVSGVWALIQPCAREPKPASCFSEAVVGLCGGLTGSLVGGLVCSTRYLVRHSELGQGEPARRHPALHHGSPSRLARIALGTGDARCTARP